MKSFNQGEPVRYHLSEPLSFDPAENSDPRKWVKRGRIKIIRLIGIYESNAIAPSWNIQNYESG